MILMTRPSLLWCTDTILVGCEGAGVNNVPSLGEVLSGGVTEQEASPAGLSCRAEL